MKRLLIFLFLPSIAFGDGLTGNVSGSNTVTNGQTGVTLSGSFAGNGAGLTNVLTITNKTVTLPAMSSGSRIVFGNDGVGTLLETVYQNGAATPMQMGLAPGTFWIANHGVNSLYFDQTGTVKFGRDDNGQVFLCNGNGTMDITDQTGMGVHLDGSGNFYFDTWINDASGHNLIGQDGSGDLIFQNGAVISSQGHWGQMDESTGQTMYFHINYGSISVSTTP